MLADELVCLKAENSVILWVDLLADVLAGVLAGYLVVAKVALLAVLTV